MQQIALLSRAALMMLAFAISAPAQADNFIRLADGWQTYVNARYGTQLDFPAELFAAGIPPENGDGLQFRSPDATLEVYAFENIERETVQMLMHRLVGREGYQDVTYSPSGYNWLVLSGTRGDTIYYEKYLFRDAVVHAFGLEFPAAEKPRYAPLIERMEDSFRAE